MMAVVAGAALGSFLKGRRGPEQPDEDRIPRSCNLPRGSLGRQSMRLYAAVFSLLGLCSACACSGSTVPVVEACGESFCIQGIAQNRLIKTTPVEDFNLYRVQTNGRLFVIYEGNAPQSDEAVVGHVRANGSAWDLLRANDHIGARSYRERLQWPQYLVVTTSCAAASQCPIEGFIRSIRLLEPAAGG
jgi:hypothetical protein